MTPSDIARSVSVQPLRAFMPIERRVHLPEDHRETCFEIDSLEHHPSRSHHFCPQSTNLSIVGRSRVNFPGSKGRTRGTPTSTSVRKSRDRGDRGGRIQTGDSIEAAGESNTMTRCGTSRRTVVLAQTVRRYCGRRATRTCLGVFRTAARQLSAARELAQALLAKPGAAVERRNLRRRGSSITCPSKGARGHK